MVVQTPAKFLSAEERSFTNQETGQLVNFYRISVLDYPELNPIELTLSQDAYSAGLPFDKLQDVVLTLSITGGQRGVRVRVEGVQAKAK